MKKRFLILLSLLFCLAGVLQAQDAKVSWSAEAVKIDDNLFEIVFSGTPAAGWHTYGSGAEYSAPELTFTALRGCAAEGVLYDISKPVFADGDPVFEGHFKLGQKVRLTEAGAATSEAGAAAEGVLTYVACTD